MHDIAGLFDAAERARGHRPLLTFSDLDADEHTELGVAAAANWVRKAANLLIEEFDARPGVVVPTAASAHWTGVLAAWAVWATGACLAVDADAPPWFVVPHVLACGDHLDAPAVDAAAMAFTHGTHTLSYKQLLQPPAESLGRVLLQAEAFQPTWCATLVAVLSHNGSLVIVRGGSTEDHERIAAQQRVTRTVQ